MLLSLAANVQAQPVHKEIHQRPYERVEVVAALRAPQKAEIIDTLLLNRADTTALKTRPKSYAAILQNCAANLDYQPTPTAMLTLQPHYDQNGVRAAEPAGTALANDSNTAYRMGFCYLMTSDTRYANTAQRILDAWATVFQTATTRQAQADINFNLPSMVLAADWVKSANGWNHGPFDTFLKTKILPLALIQNNDNQGLWGVLLKASIGGYLNQADMVLSARNRWEQILQSMVAADGSLPSELSRSDTSNYTGGSSKGIKGIAYTHYALLPAALAAKIFADTGHDVWYTHGGQLLQLAFNRAAHLTLHPETSPYYAANNGRLIGVQNGAYFPLLLKVYPNNEARAAVAEGDVKADRFMLALLFGN